ncbi:hypothetical protein UFOVP313_11 [uncultured Caudovirales phage]|uniref:Uncharacterized protein n=1 Tax=uncultured Caudovirales phage TaxID=2100421 RepID=A0A6J5LQV7_9CAUD|nr:hypothetical protein UFOVP313_11 [uncultured Caudovirales phage]
MRFALLIVLLVASPARAQLLGMDYLGLAKYCDEALKAHPTGYAVGTFRDTFGDPTVCLRKFAQSGKVPAFRIHLAWSDTHQFAVRDFDRIAKGAEAIEQLAKAYPNIKWFVSGACEHNLNRKDAELLRAKVMGRCTSCAGYVNTVWKGALIDGINEVHGNYRAPGGRYFYSPDGISYVDADAERLRNTYRGAEIFFFWDPNFNGRLETKDTTPRSQRKAWPSAKLIESLAAMSDSKQPQFITRTPAGFLYKTHADDHRDRKSHKPVILTPFNVPSITLRDGSGRVAGTLKNFGRYEDGKRYRYYSDAWGYEIAETARRQSGGAHVVVEIKGMRERVVVNPAFREPAREQ